MNFLKFLTNKGKKAPKKAQEPEEDKPQKYQLTSIQSDDDTQSYPTGKNRLTEDQKLIICKMLGEGLTNSMIVKKLEDEHQLKVPPQLIRQYALTPKWKDVIKEHRAKFLQRMDDIDVVHKAVRLKRMDYVQDRAIKTGKLSVAVSANEQIRKEFEKDGGDTNIFVNNPTYNQLNVLSTEELLRRKAEATKKLTEQKET